MARTIWWIVCKDLVAECQARRVWPAMLALGVIVGFLFSAQVDVLPAQKPRLLASYFWLATFFAGASALNWSFLSEKEDQCWEALLLYPASPVCIYGAKLLVNTLTLALLQAVLLLSFALFCDATLLALPGKVVLIALLGNLAINSLGTAVSALTFSFRQGASLLPLVLLPLVVPVILAASEATRLLLEDGLGDAGWRWIQLLIAFVVVFVAAGSLLFEFLVEE